MIRMVVLAACTVLVTVSGRAQPLTIGTVAGGGAPGLVATAYSTSGADAVTLDTSDNLYVAVKQLNQVWVVSLSGAVTEVIGMGPPAIAGMVDPERPPGATAGVVLTVNGTPTQVGVTVAVD